MYVQTLIIHIAGGTLALLAGAAALSLRKGGRNHAKAGTLFFLAMLVMAGSGTLIAALKPERGTAVIGLFTLYLVVTSWATARRRNAMAGGFERAAFVFAAACAAVFIAMGLLAAAGPTGRLDSLPAAVHYPFAALAAIAAGLDLNFILRRRLSGAQRIARHLWRMCTALLISAFSFFLGQQDEFPAALQGSPILFVPPLAILAAMIFWIFRVRFSKVWNRVTPVSRAPRPAGSEAPANA